MKDDRNPRRLLDEVLEEAPEFRAGLLDLTLREVRRRKQLRQWGRGTAAAALVFSLGIFAWRMHIPQTTAQRPPPAPAIAQAPAAIMEVRTTPAQFVPISTPKVAMVETAQSKQDFQVLTDDELLALTAGRPTVLVRQGPHQAELVFADALPEKTSEADDLQ